MRIPIAFVAFALLAVPAVAENRVALSEEQSTGRIDGPGFTVDLVMETVTDEDIEGPAPVLRILENGREMLRVVGAQSGWETPQGEAALAELDPSGEGPEVVFTSFTGGAHCCTTVDVLSRTAAGWKALAVGSYDGGVATEDLDGDGTAELTLPDNSFLYTFDCYACSVAPLQILSVAGGEVTDVTAEPRFRPAHERYLAELEKSLAESGGEKGAGWWAGWVAAKTRAGEGREGWRTFLKEWDTAADQGIMMCTDPDGCEDDASTILPLPEAMEHHFREVGLPVER